MCSPAPPPPLSLGRKLCTGSRHSILILHTGRVTGTGPCEGRSVLVQGCLGWGRQICLNLRLNIGAYLYLQIHG